ncbi:hypothetical protein FKP32DRAFT_1591204 [Trametes sanguinea]|nr:hypothetical protein FKP32DRAFT_1591204 [Trametes sanguinea]
MERWMSWVTNLGAVPEARSVDSSQNTADSVQMQFTRKVLFPPIFRTCMTAYSASFDNWAGVLQSASGTNRAEPLNHLFALHVRQPWPHREIVGDTRAGCSCLSYPSAACSVAVHLVCLARWTVEPVVEQSSLHKRFILGIHNHAPMPAACSTVVWEETRGVANDILTLSPLPWILWSGLRTGLKSLRLSSTVTDRCPSRTLKHAIDLQATGMASGNRTGFPALQCKTRPASCVDCHPRPILPSIYARGLCHMTRVSRRAEAGPRAPG